MFFTDIFEREFLEEALKEYNAAIKKDPKDKAAYVKLADIYIQTKNIFDAIDTYWEATKAIENYAEAYFMMAKLNTKLFKDGEVDEPYSHAYNAKKYYRKAMTIDSDNEEYKKHHQILLEIIEQKTKISEEEDEY